MIFTFRRLALSRQRFARIAGGLLALSIAAAPQAGADAAEAVARFRVTERIAAPAAERVSATIGAFGVGHRLMPGGDFEPIHFRLRVFASADAPAGQPDIIPVDRYALGHFDTLRDGALDGAEVSILRIESGRMNEVRRGRLRAPGGFDLSGWLPVGDKSLRALSGKAASVAIADWERGGVPRWFAVRAFDAEGRLSDFSAPVAVPLLETHGKPDDAPAGKRPGSGFEGDPLAPGDAGGPGAPAGLAARYVEPGLVQLSWTPDRAAAGHLIFQAYGSPESAQGPRLLLDPDGGAPAREGDMVILRHEITAPNRESLISDRIWRAREGRWARPPLIDDQSLRGAVRWSLEPHPDDPARGWGGRTYLRVEAEGPGDQMVLGRHNHAGTAQDWYEVLHPGRPYRVSVRLRGSQPGQAIFRLTGPYDRVEPLRLDYGTDWQEVSASFTLPALAEGKQIGRMELVLSGPGRIDVDDLRVHPEDTAFLDLDETDYARLAAANLSALRTHGLIKTGMRSYDLGALLGEGGFLVNGSQVPGLPETLRMMERAGVSPWLQIEPHFSDAEWLGLVEYLAAPFDPARDDPQALPWAALRVAQGRRAPWTEAFPDLWFEIGNETWNGLFAPWTFAPMPDVATGERQDAGTVYGLFQARIAGVLRSSPWWAASGLDRKLHFVIGGRAINDYGGRAALAAGDAADLMTIAAYNGGWDEAEGPPSPDPASFATVLNQVSQVTVPRSRQLADQAQAVARQTGRPLAIGTYEAGPGYALNGLNGSKVSADQAEAQEQVMKSRSAGVATLDTFLMQRQLGLGLQNFFTFSEGGLWTSHQPWHRGGAAYPSWALVTLLNGVGAGAMHAVEAEGGVPRRDLAAAGRREAVADAPQVAVYAASEGQRLTVFALSRRVPDVPRKGDAGCTPVEIALPPGRVVTARLIRTAGAHDDNGWSGPAPVIEEVALSPETVRDGILRIDAASGAESCGLPAASAYVYVFEMAGD